MKRNYKLFNFKDSINILKKHIKIISLISATNVMIFLKSLELNYINAYYVDIKFATFLASKQRMINFIIFICIHNKYIKEPLFIMKYKMVLLY